MAKHAIEIFRCFQRSQVQLRTAEEGHDCCNQRSLGFDRIGWLHDDFLLYRKARLRSGIWFAGSDVALFCQTSTYRGHTFPTICRASAQKAWQITP